MATQHASQTCVSREGLPGHALLLTPFVKISMRTLGRYRSLAAPLRTWLAGRSGLKPPIRSSMLGLTFCTRFLV